MTHEELRERIKYLREREKLSFYQIEQQTGTPRKKCSKLYSGSLVKAPPKEPYLERYRPLIAQWYQDCPSLKAKQVLERLQKRGAQIGYTSVILFTREFRAKKRKCYFPLTFLPGEEAQVDWFFVNHPLLGKLSGFSLILSYSRYLFAHFFPRHSFEFFIQGHLMAFDALGGHTQALRYDNLKSVVLSRNPLRYNPAFLEFANHYGFEIRLCNPARGNEKGRIERAIRTIKEMFFNTAGHHQTLRALNLALHHWVDHKNNTIHRATAKTPHQLKAEEPLQSLPKRSFQNCVVTAPKQASKTGLIVFDTNYYSVPEHLLDKPLSIHAFCDRIEIYDQGANKVATHPRSFEKNKTFLNPLHRSFTRISAEAKRQRIYTVIKNLDPAVETFLDQNAEDSSGCACHLFTLLRSYSRQTLLSAVREALRQNMPRVAFVASLLSSPSENSHEEVLPQQRLLLEIDYKPRTLEHYHHEK